MSTKKSKLTKEEIERLKNEPDYYVVPTEWTPELHDEVVEYIRKARASYTPEQRFDFGLASLKSQMKAVGEPEMKVRIPGSYVKQALEVYAHAPEKLEACNQTFVSKLHALNEEEIEIDSALAENLQSCFGIAANLWIRVQQTWDASQPSKY